MIFKVGGLVSWSHYTQSNDLSVVYSDFSNVKQVMTIQLHHIPESRQVPSQENMRKCTHPFSETIKTSNMIRFHICFTEYRYKIKPRNLNYTAKCTLYRMEERKTIIVARGEDVSYYMVNKIYCNNNHIFLVGSKSSSHTEIYKENNDYCMIVLFTDNSVDIIRIPIN